MKKNYIIIKSLWQIFLVFIEVFAISSLFVYLSSSIRPFQDKFDILERYISSIAVYEIFVYITLTFINDLRRDSLLALKTAFEEASFLCQVNSISELNNLVSKINTQFDLRIFNYPDIRQEYHNLLQYIEDKNQYAIKYTLIKIKHNYEMCNLQWKLTFLLRLFK